MLSPLRLLALGLATDDVCALYGLTPEELDLLAEEAESRRRIEPASAGKRLMTKLLLRPNLESWEMRQAER